MWKATFGGERLRCLQRLVEGYAQTAHQLEERLEKEADTAEDAKRLNLLAAMSWTRRE